MTSKFRKFTVSMFVLATVAAGLTPTAAFADVSPHCDVEPPKVRLARPASGATLAFPQQTLDWDGVRCATSYTVVIRVDAKNGPLVVKEAGLVKTEYQTNFKMLAPGHTYFWRVKACNHFGCSRSPKFTFNIQPGELPRGQ